MLDIAWTEKVNCFTDLAPAMKILKIIQIKLFKIFICINKASHQKYEISPKPQQICPRHTKNLLPSKNYFIHFDKLEFTNNTFENFILIIIITVPISIVCNVCNFHYYV